MPCYYPQTVYRSKQGRDPKTGRWPIVFDKSQGYSDHQLQIRCGRCIGCRLDKSREWSIRCYHESLLYSHNWFLTLTYDNENLDKKCGIYDDELGKIVAYSLNKVEFTKFMKRFRKHYGKGIRFFHAGEYGDISGRPHHHVGVFNMNFKDLEVYNVEGDVKLYTSEKLNKIWRNGYCVIGELTIKSAAYIARYIMKKMFGKDADEYYDGIEKEYSSCSRNLGKEYYNKYGENFRRLDTITINGKKMPVPRAYDKWFEEMDKELFELVKHRRRKKAKDREDGFERRAVKEHIKRRKITSLQRRVDNE